MRELFKNKLMIGFMIFVVTFTYITAMNQKKMEEESLNAEKQYIAMNVK